MAPWCGPAVDYTSKASRWRLLSDGQCDDCSVPKFLTNPHRTVLYSILSLPASKSLAPLAEHSQVELGSAVSSNCRRLLRGYRTIGRAALRFADERPRDSQEEPQALEPSCTVHVDIVYIYIFGS